LGQVPHHLEPPAAGGDRQGGAELLELVEGVVGVADVEADRPAQAPRRRPQEPHGGAARSPPGRPAADVAPPPPPAALPAAPRGRRYSGGRPAPTGRPPSAAAWRAGGAVGPLAYSGHSRRRELRPPSPCDGGRVRGPAPRAGRRGPAPAAGRGPAARRPAA